MKTKDITLETFKEIAKGCGTALDFMEKARKIKNVPPEVSVEFYMKYGKDGNLSMLESCKAFLLEVNKGGAFTTKWAKSKTDINLNS